ncbi:MAG: M20/M25/M40 family metallo-hydrolase [Clostridia bacterium]|nr:M20/M25/M40 family metallo-hydrolase [Clostridia bacterium]
MLNDPLASLKKYVDQPSGTFDRDDVAQAARMFAEDFQSLGFQTELIPGEKLGPKLRAAIGSGDRQLMLMGHMDTVFPRDVYVPFRDLGDGRAMGSGVIDMKGGVVVMLYALKKALPLIDLNRIKVVALLNPDEEIGSPESHDLIFQTARASAAALSFEPSSIDGRFTCARKGVTSVAIECTGIPGHAGARYKECASAIQALCGYISRLYTLRDDSRDISFNAGLISGGTAENVVAPHAMANCEFRYYNEAYKPELMEKIRAICAEEQVPRVRTAVSFGASHPAIDLNEKSQRLLDLALEICKEQGITRYHERTGGAGDIAIAGQAGIGVLDGLGLSGDQMHTVEEWAYLSSLPEQINLSAALIQRLCVLLQG